MKSKSIAKKIIIIALIIAAAVIVSPFAYTEYCLISNDYTKAGDISKIIKVNDDSEYEVLRTVRNQQGEDEQVVVARDLSEFTSLVRAEYDGNRAIFTLSNGRKCQMIHEGKNTAFCGKLYDYNIFVFRGITVGELLADDNRICVY